MSTFSLKLKYQYNRLRTRKKEELKASNEPDLKNLIYSLFLVKYG